MSHYILLGCLGGIIPDVLRLLKLGDNDIYKTHDYLKQGFFYVILLLQILFGALVVYVLRVQSNLEALVYGYAAPQVITTVAAGIIKRAAGPANPEVHKTTKAAEYVGKGTLNFKEAVNNCY